MIRCNCINNRFLAHIGRAKVLGTLGSRFDSCKTGTVNAMSLPVLKTEQFLMTESFTLNTRIFRMRQHPIAYYPISD